MKNNKILSEMGIVQWRLREAVSPAELDSVVVTAPLIDTKPLAQKEPSAEIQPSAEIEPSAEMQPSAEIEPSAGIEPSAHKEPSAEVQPATNTDSSVKTTITPQADVAEKASSDIVETHDWSKLSNLLSDHQFCRSCAQVTPILGDGDPNADWMFVFDSPSSRDVEQQSLLTGRVGQLFDAILLALGLNRDSIYLSSIFKCPPSANISSENAKCDQLLQHQIKLVQPKVVIAFGEFTAQAIIKANEDLEQLRGQQRQCFNQPITVIPTYSLMQMLDVPLSKGKVWDDLKKAIASLDS